MIIDYHSHFFQPEYFGDRLLADWQAAGYPPFPRMTLEEYEQAMSTVDRAIVFGLAACAMGVRTPHESIAAVVARNPQKYIGFMALDPVDAGAVEEMDDSARRLGLKGIKIYPTMAHVDVSDPGFTPFFKQAERLGLPVLMHFGASPFPQSLLKYSQPLLLDEVAGRFPGVNFIIAHLGHPWQRDTALLLRKHRNVYGDISGLWHRPWEGYNALVTCIEWGVTGKLLFGSDYPIWTPAAAIRQLQDLRARFAGSNLPEVPESLIAEIVNRDVLRELNLA